eukprot:120427_1
MGNKQSKLQKKSKAKINTDLGTFKQKATKCFVESKDEANIHNCDYLNRLIYGLKYYQLLDVTTGNTFVEFINIYDEALNDYIHCIHTHANDLEIIHSQLINDSDFGECS